MKRNDIEIIRILASFGIVWYHTRAPFDNIGYSGLVIFLSLSSYLYRYKPNLELRDSLISRAKRLIIPWGAWYLFYGILNLAVGNSFNPEYTSNIALNVLAGTSIHLWFLPFIFAIMVLFDVSHRFASPKTLGLVCFAISSAMLATSDLWRDPSIEMGYPIAQYTQALSAVLAGRFFGELPNFNPKVKVALLSILGISVAASFRVEGVGLPYAIGFGTMILVAYKDFSDILKWNAAKLAATTFGIYLIHILFTASLLRYGPDNRALIAVVSFLLSIISILALQKIAPSIAKAIT
ncbi:acyltransferase family protein [Pelagicoccus albus]|uniref:Acyltransferase family protein n=1 Tax=Pelagicoccus albus TaxID=415222 RepID=A0A7X1BC05_9BACT|nr:acyltransferase family protein [Pelagicoccus albus]MBC2608248.1 acyltransferase family protein [Pelagicoccus albus]